ncbi:lipoxygenase [Apiospora marii]|uniref:Manganese lipoxygenase n=1 Tax=Apiospora marii TaxID=335849 RepID=A0ABR1RG18_9PEZI
MATEADTIALNPGAAVVPNPSGPVVVRKRTEGDWPADVEKVPIPAFDTGVFITELTNVNLLPKKLAPLTDDEKIAPTASGEGTYRGTQLALTKVYDLIEKKYGSFMDTANFEPTVPSPLSLKQKKQFFIFTDPATDNYPPHLNLGANQPANKDVTKQQGSGMDQGEIFSQLRLAQLTTLLPAVVPDKFVDQTKAAIGRGVATLFAYGSMGRPDQGTTLAEVEKYNNYESSKWFYQKDIFDLPNIGNLPDWYSDARFAQQFFTGTNPTTIRQAGKSASEPGIPPESLYVQDYSYFREAAGTNDFCYTYKETYEEGGKTKEREATKYATASVCLFNLTDRGRLEPLAIIIDWRGSADKSVFIYNRELNVDEQKGDWAWRYAKTCVMASDWIQHNVTVHLCRTHLVEEAVIVAANRTLPQDHDVYQLLYPHWLKTLSLNAAARSVLVPHVVAPLMGVPNDNVYQFLRWEYEHYDFQGSYIPEDLRRRGFPAERLNDLKYHNYAWARCIHSMWYKIRGYVREMLLLKYTSADRDHEVRQDDCVQAWSREMRAPAAEQGANLASFPELTSFAALVDCVTMCIHIASPQHTSVNYLQNYYQAFVVNKPPALYRAPPTSRDQLLAYTEQDLVAALPMNRPHEWLLASHIPYLLSFKPGDKESLIIYAASKYHVYKCKTEPKEQRIKEAAARFYEELARSEAEFKTYGEATDDQTITYDVLSPSWNAVSILI